MNPEEIPEALPTEPAPEPVAEEPTETPSEIAAREAEINQVQQLAMRDEGPGQDILDTHAQGKSLAGMREFPPVEGEGPEQRGLLHQVADAAIGGVELQGGGQLGDDSTGPEGHGGTTEQVPMVDPLVAIAATTPKA